MKTWILLLLITISCTKMTQKTIEVVSIQPATPLEIQENNLGAIPHKSIVISSAEDLTTINPKMSFGFVAVEKREDFALPQEELVKKHLIFEVISLKKIEANQYQFFVNSALLPTNKTIFCRLERPGFVMKEGYHSPIFKLKIQ